MFHVKHILLSFLSLTVIAAFSQGTVSMRDVVINYAVTEDATLRKTLNDWAGYKALAQEEKDVVYYLNYARQNPQLFLQNAINTFLINHPETKSSYTKSLQKTFASLAPLPVIFPDAVFSVVSEAHALDLSSHNKISHTSTDGRSFQQRVSPFVKECGSESIHATPRFSAIESVLNLLFDFNVPDLGHRKSLLDPRYHRAGVGVSINPKGNSIVVIDFSCQ